MPSVNVVILFSTYLHTILVSFPFSYDELLQSSDEEDEGNEDGAWVSKKERGRLFWKNRRDKKHGSHEFKKEEGKAWIKEGPEDEPVNFMDPVVAKKVVGG